MKKLIVSLVVLGLFFGMVGTAMAVDSVTQTVTFEVKAINEISVSGNPGALIVDTVTTPGDEPDTATDSSTTYSITTNGTNKKITAGISAAMPTDTTLIVNLASSVGTSAGDVDISNATPTAVDVVTDMSKGKDKDKMITYTFSATVAAGVLVSDTRTVTFTITAGT